MNFSSRDFVPFRFCPMKDSCRENIRNFTRTHARNLFLDAELGYLTAMLIFPRR